MWKGKGYRKGRQDEGKGKKRFSGIKQDGDEVSYSIDYM